MLNNSQIIQQCRYASNSKFFAKPTDESVSFSKHIYGELAFEVTHNAAPHNNFVIADDIRLVDYALVALFSENKMNISSGKQFERNEYSHAVCLI